MFLSLMAYFILLMAYLSKCCPCLFAIDNIKLIIIDSMLIAIFISSAILNFNVRIVPAIPNTAYIICLPVRPYATVSFIFISLGILYCIDYPSSLFKYASEPFYSAYSSSKYTCHCFYRVSSSSCEFPYKTRCKNH